MELKAGVRLRSAVSEAEVIVVRAGGDEVEITCGGVPMVEGDTASSNQAPLADDDGSVVLGKRYIDEGDILEVLCTKPGAGTLAVGGRPLVLKSAKPLPSSD